MKYFLRSLLFVTAVCADFVSIGQTATDTVRDIQNYNRQSATFSTAAKSGNRYHYIGFQANQILRQLVGGAGSADNPYLISYSFNSVDRGGGMNFGLGFNFSTTDDLDPNTNIKRTTQSNNISFRMGYDMKKSIGRRWIAGYGFDVLLKSGNTETDVVFSVGGPTQNSTTTKVFGFGTGPRLSLLFNVSEKIFLGTEASIYFVSENTKSKGTPSVPSSFEQELKTKSFKIAAPTSLFLILRF